MDKIFDFFIKNPILQIAHDIYIVEIHGKIYVSLAWVLSRFCCFESLEFRDKNRFSFLPNESDGFFLISTGRCSTSFVALDSFSVCLLAVTSFNASVSFSVISGKLDTVVNASEADDDEEDADEDVDDTVSPVSEGSLTLELQLFMDDDWLNEFSLKSLLAWTSNTLLRLLRFSATCENLLEFEYEEESDDLDERGDKFETQFSKLLSSGESIGSMADLKGSTFDFLVLLNIWSRVFSVVCNSRSNLDSFSLWKEYMKLYYFQLAENLVFNIGY